MLRTLPEEKKTKWSEYVPKVAMPKIVPRVNQLGFHRFTYYLEGHQPCQWI